VPTDTYIHTYIHTYTDKKTDLIICPMLWYSNGTDKNVYYYGGKIYAAGQPYSVKSRNHRLAYPGTLHDSKYADEDAHVS